MSWKYQRYMHDYLGCVKAVDESVGQILKFLDDDGLAGDTIVVYSSDQGFYLGEHGWFDKRWIFEESLRSPLLVRWPGVVKPGSRVPARLQYRLRRNVSRGGRFTDSGGHARPKPCSHLERPDTRQLAIELLLPVLRVPVPHHVRPHHGVVTDRYKLVHFDGPDLEEWELFDRDKRSA